ncbi:MAG: selenocysteine-specific translation elongation factor [Acidimicrobiia bacterium]|nr:selenocysteine-specific translation elongation factor [Acidimicrobiia bacterium]
MPIVGTAGHVDHGKSTLVMALTGTDPDRWSEEKRRGLTIDLGFAAADIDGLTVGFVDVPGHERFIKNMLAGVTGVDCALLVVAADSGWMPQTEEHVRILDLVGAPTGVIAVTRADLVDDDTLELTMLEIGEEVEGTSLASWPVIPVSPVTGVGLDGIRRAIGTALAGVHHRDDEPYRLWVDRVFVIHGSGVVATGTVQRGSVAIDDEIELHPGGSIARVRGLHQHDRPVERITAGQRAAINLGGVTVDDLHRGTLLARPGTASVTRRFISTWRTGRGHDDLPSRGAYHVHSGTADTVASIRRVAEDLLLVSTETPIPVIAGDRFILRESGRQSVVGGGQVLDPAPLLTIDTAAIDAYRSPSPYVDRILEAHGVVDAENLSRATGGATPADARRIGVRWVTESVLRDLSSTITPMVAAYHRDHPLRPGYPVPELADRVGVPPEVLTVALAGTTTLKVTDGAVADVEFSSTLSTDDEAAWDTVRAVLERSYAVPRVRDLGLDPELVRALIRRGDIVQVAPDLVFTATQLGDLEAHLTDLPDGFTVSGFGERFGTARRQSVPLLEWFDKRGITRREGDQRIVRNR